MIECIGIQEKFQPTPSARRVTAAEVMADDRYSISTHTLRKEGDGYGCLLVLRVRDFNPHPPQGG